MKDFDFVIPKYTHEVMVTDNETGLEFSYSRHQSASSAMSKLEILKTITTYPPTIREILD